MDTLLIKNMIESDVKVDIYGDMYGHDRVADCIGAYISGLKVRIAELENEASDDFYISARERAERAFSDKIGRR